VNGAIGPVGLDLVVAGVGDVDVPGRVDGDAAGIDLGMA
jgi:hypothetical protein